MLKKKTTAILLTIAVLLSVAAFVAGGALATDSIIVYVNDRLVVFPDAPAYIDNNNRAQIPMRYVAEALGADVEWDGAARRATFSREVDGNTRYVDFYIDSEDYYVKNAPDYRAEKKTMDTVAVIENERTYVPVRYVAEALEATTRWDGMTRSVYITLKAPIEEQTPKKVQKPADGEMYDNHGLLLPPYANEFYQKLFETLQITYEGERVFFSYTIPEGIPEDIELVVSLGCEILGEYYTKWFDWSYMSFIIRAADKGTEPDYLIPSPISGEVRKEIEYIPLEAIYYIYISCGMQSPRGGLPSETERRAQSGYRININAQNLKESELRKGASNWWSVNIPEYIERIKIDGATIVKFK